MLSSVEAWRAGLCARAFDKLKVTDPFFLPYPQAPFLETLRFAGQVLLNHPHPFQVQLIARWLKLAVGKNNYGFTSFEIIQLQVITAPVLV